MAVEREGEGQENEGGRDGKGMERLKKAKKTEGNDRGNLPKLSINKKGRIVHYDALSYIKAPAFGNRGFVIKKEGVPFDTPSKYLLISIRIISEISLYRREITFIIKRFIQAYNATYPMF